MAKAHCCIVPAWLRPQYELVLVLDLLKKGHPRGDEKVRPDAAPGGTRSHTALANLASHLRRHQASPASVAPRPAPAADLAPTPRSSPAASRR